ncbi:iron(III) transport system ATP-binding protein [Arthrobacter sp. cf158]|uniref:ABC transporter ATP-binding protein n=1 Tax=Arthrobacter sp. cf158 TaxID=1761744 RepID=UPI00089BC7E6|nr:ABC transporter ATP-binding protein [Arthrobacter sp. cf158]SDX50267.1 iron(III) transport system ATP-binding protein [Arthrobacter sp. cf158]
MIVKTRSLPKSATQARDTAATLDKSASAPNGKDLRLEITALKKDFVRSGGMRVPAVDDVTLEVHSGEIVVLLGPSGCGKSTLLRCIAGLETPDTGTIRISGETVFAGSSGLVVPPERRDINMMFQSYALWPHMTLEDNVSYPLRVAGVKAASARKRAEEYLDLVGLAGLGRQHPSNISGGQQQRAALARTLISEPAVVLFDEPLSNVDAKVRIQLRSELARIHRELGFAAVYVTHDQVEAMGVGTSIAVMRGGKIAQLDQPVELYEYPTSRYSAEFVGDANIFEGRIVDVTGEVSILSTPVGNLRAKGLRHPRLSAAKTDHESVIIMVRPEYCTLAAPGDHSDPASNRIQAVVESVLYGGSRTEYTCRAGDQVITAWASEHVLRFQAGDHVTVGISEDSLRIVDVER